jgi:predicted type IV restriction endonuclease
MASISKKIIERYVKAVPRFQKVVQIAKDRDVNESDTVSILNDILGDVFGYDKYLEVTSEFAVRSTYCDLAIKVDDKPQFLIEAKAIGIDLKDNHIRQAIDYGAKNGTQWVVLSNSIEWRIYRIRFEKPLNYDLVCSFNFLNLNPKDEKDQECLFILSKEGLVKSAREDFYEKVQSVNRHIIGSLILCEPVLTLLRKELKRLADGVRVENNEIRDILSKEVLKREVVEGDEAETAKARVIKFYKKCSAPIKKKTVDKDQGTAAPAPHESVSERLLREAAEDDPTCN